MFGNSSEKTGKGLLISNAKTDLVIKMEKYANFIWGAALAGILGWAAYSGASQNNDLLRKQIRQQRAEFAEKQTESLQLILQLSETEKENIRHYKDIVDTTKQYSRLVYEKAVNGSYENVEEIVQISKKLEQSSQSILDNNRLMYESIQRVVGQTKEF
jgi:hypothetical protein